VIGKLPGEKLHVVKIDSLVGVFSAPNLLQMAPWLHEKLRMPNVEGLDVGTVKLLLMEFTKLSTDDFTEEMVGRIFTLLKDTSE
jgi:hypothetical protein